MANSGHLWAIGYDDMERANQVRDHVTNLGWDKHSLILDGVAVVVRHPDGSFTLNREPFPAASDDEGDMDLILHAIRGLGGTVLKTNVDVERARLIQSTIAAEPDRRP